MNLNNPRHFAIHLAWIAPRHYSKQFNTLAMNRSVLMPSPLCAGPMAHGARTADLMTPKIPTTSKLPQNPEALEVPFLPSPILRQGRDHLRGFADPVAELAPRSLDAD
jgi:hypothetical protein